MNGLRVCYDKDRALALSSGLLLMYALPLSAVVSGWELSASLGTDAGDVLSLLIFILGCAVVITSFQMSNRRIYTAIKMLTAVCGAVLAAVHGTGGGLSAADLFFIAAALGECNSRRCIKFLIAAAATFAAVMVCSEDLSKSVLLLPLLGSLLSGTAICTVSEIQKKDVWHIAAGMIIALAVRLL